MTSWASRFRSRTCQGWIQWVTYLMPVRYFLVIVLGIFLKGFGMAVLRPGLIAVAKLESSKRLA